MLTRNPVALWALRGDDSFTGRKEGAERKNAWLARVGPCGSLPGRLDSDVWFISNRFSSEYFSLDIY